MNAPEIQQEIERTRERLGETVEELAAKADVKARARDKAAETKARAQSTAIDATAKAQDKAIVVSARVKQNELVQRRWPLAAAAAGVALISAIVIWRRRKT